MSEVSCPALPRLLLFTHAFRHRGSPQRQTQTSRACIHPELDNVVKRISQDGEHRATAILLMTLAPLDQNTWKFLDAHVSEAFSKLYTCLLA